MNNKKGLGRGLNALFSVFEEEFNEQPVKAMSAQPTKKEEPKILAEEPKLKQPAPANSGVTTIAIENIFANPNQPRKHFDETAIAELAESIKIHGVIQPIIVNDCKDGTYMIIAGERRFRSAQLAGLTNIPAIVKNFTERQIKEVSLIENLQREDLNPIEAARAIKQLMDEYNFTQEVVAERIGKSRPNISNLIRLLSLTPEVIALVENGSLSAGHARTLVVIEDKNLQIKVAQTAIDKKLSVREIEKLVKALLKPRPAKRERITEQSTELINFTENMQRIFSTKVTVLGSDNKGRICIDYFSKDDLDRIYELLEIIDANKNKNKILNS